MMTQQCIQCSKTFRIDDQDFEFYKKMSVPAPEACPQCRLVRRLLERNARSLYQRKCDFSGRDIISQFAPDQPFPVYDQKIWWSDVWDALDYGRDFDFTRPFFEQFQELVNAVPHMSVFIIGGTMENSDYTNCAGYLKDCYLVSEADYNENCYYSNRLFHNNKDVVDCSESYHNELCYECVDCQDSYQLLYSQESQHCLNSYFLYNCRDCKDCLGCINQRHQQYKIFNQQYTQTEYETLRVKFQLHTRSGLAKFRAQCQEFFSTQIYQHLQVQNNQASFGDHLYNSNNATYCFDGTKLENCRYCVKVLEAKDCMDHTSWGMNAELTYECASSGDNIYDLKFCSTCTTNVRHCEYSYLCTASTNLFGCVGIRQKQYCILNKQYSLEEYAVLKARIIEHMRATGEYGKFFPKSLSPFAYNETIAMDYFPLTREVAVQQGYSWREDNQFTAAAMAVLPDTLTETSDQVLQQVFGCTSCGKPYKIIRQELAFYRQLNIPLPDQCYTCRHLHRMSQRNPIELWQRQCMCTQTDHGHHGRCAEEFETNFAPERKEIIYCQTCYQKSVY